MVMRIIVVMVLVVSASGVASGLGLVDTLFASDGPGLRGGNGPGYPTGQPYNNPANQLGPYNNPGYHRPSNNIGYQGGASRPVQTAQLWDPPNPDGSNQPPSPPVDVYPAQGSAGYTQYQPIGPYGEPGAPQQGYDQPAGQAPGAAPYGYQPPAAGAYPQQGQYAPPQGPPLQAQYGPPPAGQQQYAPPPPRPQGQYGPQQEQYPQQQGQYGPPQGAQQQQQGQYGPQQGAQPREQGQPDQDNDMIGIPSGAVRVTTQTQDGTTVQYYPPVGQPATAPAPPPQVRPGVRAKRAASGGKPIRQVQRKKPGPGGQEVDSLESGGYIATPMPVEIPKNRDPRLGFTGRAR